MREKEIVKNTYEVPVIEVIEFSLKDSIAESAVSKGAFNFEEIWGD